MSVLISMKITGDTDVFRKALADRGNEFAEIAERARPKGALHHQFGVGDGFVLSVDEWESAEQFQAFFADPDLQAFIGTAGGDASTPPEITITESIDSPDRF
jgi:hypothetical protein